MSERSQFKDLWGEHASWRGYVPVSRLLLNHLHLIVPTPPEQIVLLKLVLIAQRSGSLQIKGMTQQQLGSQLHLSRSSVNRSLQRLKGYGVIESTEVELDGHWKRQDYSLEPLQKILEQIGRNAEGGARSLGELFAGVDKIINRKDANDGHEAAMVTD